MGGRASCGLAGGQECMIDEACNALQDVLCSVCTVMMSCAMQHEYSDDGACYAACVQ